MTGPHSSAPPPVGGGPDPTTPESLTVIAAQVGITVAPERLPVVSAFASGLAPGLAELRAVPLSFLEPVEPGTALRWIARGGA
jgi:hypothetical protein